MPRLVRKLFILGVLLAMPWALSSTGNGPVRASVCCSVCDQQEQNCLDGCIPEDRNCPTRCGRIWQRCHATCNPSC
jgi:hypothetical protein